MTHAPILEMRQIRKTFPGVVALDGVDFELRRGEVHILLGENGAGKSTLMKILSGAYQKSAGGIKFGGEEVEIRNPAHAQALGISTIYQEFNLVPHLSVGENIYLGREPTRLPGLIDRRAVNRRAGEVLHGLGLKLDPRRPVRGLRVAEQQMVEVAKALSLDARVLIMDEPTAALSEHEIKELFAAIRGLKAKGVSVVYISHRMEELFEIGDRVTVLRDGRSVATLDVAATDKFELIRLMVNRDLTELFPKERAERGAEVLRVENLTTRGGLKGVSFTLHRGEVLGIAGLLGAGRTELARAIFGLDKVEAGTVHVKGEAKRIGSPRAAINNRIGFLTEDRKAQGLVLPLSVKENICLPSVDRFTSLGVVNFNRERRAAERYVRELRIRTPGLDQRVAYLSGGNQQKVVLSKWLCSEAEVFIFDEPTRGVDVGAKAEIYRIIDDLAAAGKAVLMVSSEMNELLSM
ncbi:MAG TPA: sugar ABC transporter ATP-binding protein, partial [Pyrinomonadaceae bacterium]